MKYGKSKMLICEIMGFVRIQAYLPKTSISGQIVSEILAQLCSDDSIQIPLNLTWQSFKTQHPPTQT